MQPTDLPFSVKSLHAYDPATFSAEASFLSTLAIATEIFDAQKMLPLGAFVFTRTNPRSAVHNPWVVCTMLRIVNEQYKNMFGHMLRDFIAATKARAIVFMSEIWDPPMDGMAREEAEALRRQIEAYARTNGGSWEGFPGMGEALYATCETVETVLFAKAKIQRDAKRNPTLLPWVIEPVKALGEARFTGLLRENETTHA